MLQQFVSEGLRPDQLFAQFFLKARRDALPGRNTFQSPNAMAILLATLARVGCSPQAERFESPPAEVVASELSLIDLGIVFGQRGGRFVFRHAGAELAVAAGSLINATSVNCIHDLFGRKASGTVIHCTEVLVGARALEKLVGIWEMRNE